MKSTFIQPDIPKNIVQKIFLPLPCTNRISRTWWDYIFTRNFTLTEIILHDITKKKQGNMLTINSSEVLVTNTKTINLSFQYTILQLLSILKRFMNRKLSI